VFAGSHAVPKTDAGEPATVHVSAVTDITIANAANKEKIFLIINGFR